MKRRRTVGAVAFAAVIAMGLAACGGGSSGSTSSSGGSGGGSAAKPAFNAAVSSVFNASNTKGGVLTMANSGDWDSLDPANTYYA